MHRFAIHRPRRAAAPLAALAIVLAAGPAAAQMLDQPWSFSQTNRASIAFSLRNGGDPGAGTTTGSGGPVIVCGGGGSTAAGNNTCIVLNNANGQIELDQASDGSQDATNTQQVTTTNATASDADDVLSILGDQN